MLLKTLLLCSVLSTALAVDKSYLVEGKPCIKAGVMCEDSNRLMSCEQKSDGTWVKNFLRNCYATGEICKDDIGTCVKQDSIIYEKNVREFKFGCTSVGLFPDPFDCRKFHICVLDKNGFVPYERRCFQNMAFDVATKSCRIRIGDDECPAKYVLPVCERLGQVGPVNGDNGLYFMCNIGGIDGEAILRPEIHTCPYNFIFDGAGCIDREASAGLIDGKCIAAGLFYSPLGCTRYSQCLAAEEDPWPRTCIGGSFFAPHQQRCIPFDCLED